MSPDLDVLIRLFYADRAALGRFVQVEAAELPELARSLLAHEQHMTVTVEGHYGCPVDVRVLNRRSTPTHYFREIVLSRQTDGRVVQYGIVRIHLDCLAHPVREEVLSERTPLGRILIEHDVLRRVRLFSLWRVSPAARLRSLLELDSPESVHVSQDRLLNSNGDVFGRTALIDCNHEPAIELLEIVNLI